MLFAMTQLRMLLRLWPLGKRHMSRADTAVSTHNDVVTSGEIKALDSVE